MLPQKPEAWPEAFERCLEAGDLDGAVDLYEPDAQFVAPSGQVIRGHDGIRGMLATLLATGTRMCGRVQKTFVVDDIALLYTDFAGQTRDDAGTTTDVTFRAVEILRRQPDGTWRLIVGDPGGRT